jgi:hypothetical protein
MRKLLISTAAALVLSASAFAKTGHVLQIHHGGACLEFVLYEDAVAACGTDGNNIWLSTGAINDACLEGVQWYGLSTGTTFQQLSQFINFSTGIETAFNQWQASLGLYDVQRGEGFAIPQDENNNVYNLTKIGFDISTAPPLSCGDIAGHGQRQVLPVVNINLPPSPSQ